MTRLSRSDLEAVLDFAGEVAVAAREPDRADARLLALIGRLVDAEMPRYSRIDASYRLLWETVLPDPLPPQSDELIEALRSSENPYDAYARRTGQPYFPATRLFDIVDRKAFSRTNLFQLIPFGDAPAVQMRMDGGGGTKWRLEVLRPGREFSDRELALLDAIRPWLELYEDLRALARHVAAVRTAPIDQRRASRLSVRENQVLDRVADGSSNQEVADALHISSETVRKHLENIYAKLEVTSRTGALARTGRTSVPTGEPQTAGREWSDPAAGSGPFAAPDLTA